MKTIEQKARAYDKAISLIKDYKQDEKGFICVKPENIFPELAESDDEKIRREIIRIVDIWTNSAPVVNGIPRENLLAWLEKQGEPFNDNIITRDDEVLQAISIGLTDAKEDFGWSDFGGLPIEEIQEWLEKQGEKEEPQVYEIEDGVTITYSETDGYNVVEPKFKVGDWITNGEYTWKVKDIKSLDYILQSQDGHIVDDTISYVDYNFRLWTIKDARDGDILVDLYSKDSIIILYKGLYKERSVLTHCGWNGYNLSIKTNGLGYGGLDNTNYFPATQEQRNTLKKAMADAGWEFDFDKKELKKIEQKPAEWSEEDERNMQNIDSVLFYDKKLPEDTCVKLRNFLKSLKDRVCCEANCTTTWKPSDEQMEALERSLDDYSFIVFDDRYKICKSLYNDLKKL